MKKMTVILALCAGWSVLAHAAELKTVCNPVNISYRFRPEVDEISRREAADPTVITFKGTYWLFASKSGGYWHSQDLIEWAFVQTDEIPTEAYAPTAVVIDDTVYMAVSSKTNSAVYQTTDPESGKWIHLHSLPHPVEDPAFYLDDDNRLYLYWGCSNEDPLYAAEIDKNTFQFIGDVHEVIHQNPKRLGWEVRGDNNTEYNNPPWLEGCWMTKRNGIYYLQYSAPGTREKSYADGVYVGAHPLGPFKLAPHNPFACKPEGFACGAGHGSTIQDAYGNYWHFGTITISSKHIFERRVGFYPAFFDEEGVLYSTTRYGDYPISIPDRKIGSFDDIWPGWMLLSYRKPVTVSSVNKNHKAEYMCDENIRTYWAAETGSDKEWACVDLERLYDIYALQINFAEQDAGVHGRKPGLHYRYLVEGSRDGQEWFVMVDRSLNEEDQSHDYIQLKAPVKNRYLRITNREVPGGAFALSGFRVFGKGDGDPPAKTLDFKAVRNPADRRSVHLNWDSAAQATGYNISYGSMRDKRYHNHIVYDKHELTVNNLHAQQSYFFSIEAFNENGITPSSQIIEVE